MASDSMDSKKPKVCMLAYCESPTSYPPMFHEGVSLGREGFEAEALCFAATPEARPSEVHAPGFRTRRFRLRTRSFFHALLGPSTKIRILAALQYALSYGEYVTKSLVHALASGADAYEGNDLPALLPALLAARIRRRPVVYRAHELFSETQSHVPFAWFWRLLDRLLVPKCDEVVTPEENRSRIYLDEFGANHLPMTVRNCPPYRPPMRSARLREELVRRGVNCPTIVLYQGLIDSMRCIEEIAEATRYFDAGVVLVIIGGGYGKWADAAAVLARYDRVVVLPRVPYEELPAYTASADIGILLYRNDCRNNYYCAPNKVFEYMMMGLPVIAANYPGMISLVEGEAVGVCVNPGDARAIAAAVNRMAAEPEARMRYGANGLRRSMERYHWDAEFQPLLMRYRALLEPRFSWDRQESPSQPPNETRADPSTRT